MENYILHERENCIGCGACVSLDEDNWEMGDDGKSQLKGSDDENKKEIKLDEVEECKETAEACPVNVIHIYKENKKIF